MCGFTDSRLGTGLLRSGGLQVPVDAQPVLGVCLFVLTGQEVDIARATVAVDAWVARYGS